MTGMPLTMQQALPKVNGVISADYDLSSVPVATVFVTFFIFVRFLISRVGHVHGKTTHEC